MCARSITRSSPSTIRENSNSSSPAACFVLRASSAIVLVAHAKDLGLDATVVHYPNKAAAVAVEIEEAFLVEILRVQHDVALSDLPRQTS